MYAQTYGILEPGLPWHHGLCRPGSHLRIFATSDAAYHDVNHTIMACSWQEILRGRRLRVGGVNPPRVVAFHRLTAVPPASDTFAGSVVAIATALMLSIPPAIKLASLRGLPGFINDTLYHVARSKLFVRERFGKVALTHLDTAEIETNVGVLSSGTKDEQHDPTGDFPGLLAPQT